MTLLIWSAWVLGQDNRQRTTGVSGSPVNLCFHVLTDLKIVHLGTRSFVVVTGCFNGLDVRSGFRLIILLDLFLGR